MKKKGQAGAIIGFLALTLVFVFGLYIAAIPMAKVWDDISAEYKQPENFGSDNRTVEAIEKVDSFITPGLDQLVFISMIGLFLVLIVSGIFFRDHPIFIVFLIIGVIIIVIISSQIVNVADTVVNNDQLDDKADEFKLSGLLFGNQLPILILVMGLVAVVIVMATRGQTA